MAEKKKINEKIYLWALKKKALGRFLLEHVKVGKFETPSGEEYTGFKFWCRW